MNEESVRSFIKEDISLETISLMKAMLDKSIPSRTFLLNELDTKLQDVLTRSGKYATYSEEQLLFVESCIYVEIVERIFLVTEDLNAICFALSGDLSQVVPGLLNPKKGFIKGLSAEGIRKLLRYSDLEDLALSESERSLLERVRESNIYRFTSLFTAITEFDRIYRPLFLKRKHANPLIFGFVPIEMDDERAVSILTPFDSGKPGKVKGLLVTESIYSAWKGFFNLLITAAIDLIERAVVFAETGGSLLVEHSAFTELSKEDKDELGRIIDLHQESKYRLGINININANIAPHVVKAHLALRDLLQDLGLEEPHIRCSGPEPSQAGS